MRHVAKEPWWRERRRGTRRRFRGFELIVSKCVVTNIVGCPNGLPIAQQPKTHEDCSQAALPPFLVYLTPSLCWLLICIDFVQQIKRFVFASFLSHLLFTLPTPFTPPFHSLYTNKFVSISCSSIQSLSVSLCLLFSNTDSICLLEKQNSIGFFCAGIADVFCCFVVISLLLKRTNAFYYSASNMFT